MKLTATYLLFFTCLFCLYLDQIQAKLYTYTVNGYPNTAENVGSNCAPWYNLGNLNRAGRAINAAIGGDRRQSCYLHLTNFTWLNHIPPTYSTVQGITVITVTSTGGSNFDILTVQMIVNNNRVGSNEVPGKRGVSSPNQLTKEWGGDRTLFGLPWNPSDFQSSTFGVALRFERQERDVRTFNLHSVQIRLTFSVDIFPTYVDPNSELGRSGGQNVTIYGVNFLDFGRTPRARFGQAPATCFKSSYTDMICTAPPQTTNGPVVVTVAPDGNIFTTEQNVTYTYLDDSTCHCSRGICINETKECDCTGTGYYGPTCDIPYICTPGCERGWCTPELVCNCTGTGYIGSACEVELNCTPPCMNGGICNEDLTCSCIDRYEGEACERICIPACLNGGRCTLEGCDCSGIPFGGPICATPLEEIQVSPSGSTEGGSEAIIALTVILVVLLIIIVFAGIIGFYVYRKRGGVSRGPRRLTKPNYNALLYADKAAASVSASTLKSFEQLLVQDEFELALAIARGTPVSESDAIAKSLAYVLEYHSKFVDYFSLILTREVSTASDENLVFRNTTFASGMFKYYAQLVGMEYLFNTLAIHVSELVEADDGENRSSIATSVELDPYKMNAEDDQSINKLQLQLCCQKVFVSVIKSVDNIPRQLRVIFHLLAKEMEKKFGSGSGAQKAVGGLMFLRFISPALVAPHVYGLCKEPPPSASQRKLVLVTKVLQNLVNGVAFGGKEEYMQVLNPFLEDNRDKVATFIKQITVYPQDSGSEKVQMPLKAKDNSLSILYSGVQRFRENVLGELQNGDTKRNFEEVVTPIA